MTIDSKNIAQQKYMAKANSSIVNISPPSELDKINPLTYQQLIDDKPLPFENVVEPIIPDPGYIYIYASTGVGKTMFTLNLAYSIASGKDFLKYKVKKPRKVLYIDGEMKYQIMHSRFMSIVEQQGKTVHADNWNLYTPDKFLPFKLPKICDPVGQAFYSKKIDELGIEILILDNLSTLSTIEESSSEEWKIIQDWIIYLRSKDITVILIHHAGKAGDYRGTSRMIDCADTVILLDIINENIAESDKNNTKKIKIVYKKNRTFSGQDAIPFEVTFSPLGWSFDSLEKTNKARIAEMHDMNMSAPEIALEIGVNRSYVYKVLKKIRPK